MLFDIERGIVGETAEHRLAVRKELSAPVLADLKDWMEAERVKLSKHSPVAKAMDICSGAGSCSPASSTTAASA